VRVEFVVNGAPVSVEVEPRRTLAEVLREELALTGTHLGCEHGVCGACTVVVDGAAVRSCLQLAAQADGTTVETIESLAASGEFHPIQAAMRDGHGFQCTFCSPGFMMSLKALLDANPTPSRDELREELSGNLCRCTGYASILAAAERVAGLQPEGPEPAGAGHA
jgi:carbon-monoxide dehydrogenase small subunit